MLYLKVKPQFDNYRKNNKFDIFVGNELYTLKEFEKIKKEYHRNIQELNNIFEYVNVSKRKLYWFFGARFSNDTGGVALPF